MQFCDKFVFFFTSNFEIKEYCYEISYCLQPMLLLFGPWKIRIWKILAFNLTLETWKKKIRQPYYNFYGLWILVICVYMYVCVCVCLYFRPYVYLRIQSSLNTSLFVLSAVEMPTKHVTKNKKKQNKKKKNFVVIYFFMILRWKTS